MLFALVLLILDNPSLGQTNIPGGDVYGVWDLAGSPYLIEESVTIPNDSSLTIEPGVVVEFQGYYSLQVQGQLSAVGTPSDSILFTVNDTTGFAMADTSLGAWNGIRFTDTPVENDTSRLIHCCLQYSKAVGPVWHLNAGGAISVLQFGKVVIANCLIRNNMAGSPTDHVPIGGGLYLFKSDALITGNMFVDNQAHSGGAVYMDDSNPVFRKNLITGNKAVWGGGIGVGGGELHADDCQFTDNYAEIWGGGIAGDFATLHINGCTFKRDSSGWGSGGLHMDHAVGEISNSTFTDNKAVFGGGFHAVFSQVEAVNNEFIGNRTGSGAGIHLENSDGVINECKFEDNQAMEGTGGAIDFWADSTIFDRVYHLHITHCLMQENSSSVHSGALRIEQPDIDSSLVGVVIDSCSFLRNHSDMYGSLIIRGPIKDFRMSNSIIQGNTSTRRVSGPGFSIHAKGLVYNCVFFANYAQYTDSTINAHGASLGLESAVDFIHCTFADTTTFGGVGLGVRRGSTANLLNCIFRGTGDRPISIVTAVELGSTVSVNYCDIENGIDSIYVSDSLSTLVYGEGNISSDPLFVDLGNGDLHLSDASPCIGAGINALEIDGLWVEAPANDIEGVARPSPQNSQPDMGAYEHPLGYPVSNHPGDLLDDNEDPGLSVFPNPFRESVVIAYHVSTASVVDVSIYNSTGQLLETLVSAFQPTGEYQVSWSATSYSDGIYFCRIRTNRENIQTVKLILLK